MILLFPPHYSQSHRLCLSIEVFRLFIFNVIINIIGFKSLLLVLLYFLFFLPVSCLLPSSALNIFMTTFYLHYWFINFSHFFFNLKHSQISNSHRSKLFEIYFLQCWGLNSGPVPWATSPALFCEGFFEIGSPELFAQAGFEPRSS
jgi:hypothetical protein